MLRLDASIGFAVLTGSRHHTGLALLLVPVATLGLSTDWTFFFFWTSCATIKQTATWTCCTGTNCCASYEADLLDLLRFYKAHHLSAIL